MAKIIVNDIFEELIEENFKINECLNVLIRFKTFVDLISDKLKTNLDSKSLQMFEDFNKEVEEVFGRNQIDFLVHKNTNQRKLKLIEFLASKSQTNHENSQTSVQSVDSSKLKFNGLKRTLMSMKKKRPNNNKQLMNENKLFVCDFIGCGKRFNKTKNLRTHQRIHSTKPKPHQCHFEGCHFSTRVRVELMDHINHHNGVKPFCCQLCDKWFTSEKLRKLHNKRNHEISDQILVCNLEECYKQFKTELALKSHQKFSHLSERRYACSEGNCSFRTISEKLLKTHIFHVHSGQRPFPCNIEGCSKTFKTSSQLRQHIELHSSERKFKCLFEGCGKAFKTAAILKLHTVLHEGSDLKCEWPGCEYTAKAKQRLKEHNRLHSAERNFACSWPQCEKRFKTKPHLKTHFRIHVSDKRYACSWPGCQYRCTDTGNLVKHKRVHIKT